MRITGNLPPAASLPRMSPKQNNVLNQAVTAQIARKPDNTMKNIKEKVHGLVLEQQSSIWNELSEDDIKLAKGLLKKMAFEVREYSDRMVENQENAKKFLAQKDRYEAALDGSDESFGTVTLMEAAEFECRNRKFGAKWLALLDLSEKDQSLAYAVYGKEFLQLRTEYLDIKLDQIKWNVDWDSRITSDKLSRLQVQWNENFGGDHRLKELVESFLPDVRVYLHKDSPTFWEDLNQSVEQLKRCVEQSHKAIDIATKARIPPRYA